MKASSHSVWIFGIYLFLEGLFIMLAPAEVLAAMGLPDTESIWRIIVGFVVVVLGYYYIRNARENLTPFFQFTVHIRILQLGFFIYLYLFVNGPIILVGLAIIEALSGVWTWLALRKERQ